MLFDFPILLISCSGRYFLFFYRILLNVGNTRNVLKSKKTKLNGMRLKMSQSKKKLNDARANELYFCDKIRYLLATKWPLISCSNWHTSACLFSN